MQWFSLHLYCFYCYYHLVYCPHKQSHSVYLWLSKLIYSTCFDPTYLHYGLFLLIYFLCVVISVLFCCLSANLDAFNDYYYLYDDVYVYVYVEKVVCVCVTDDAYACPYLSVLYYHSFILYDHVIVSHYHEIYDAFCVCSFTLSDVALNENQYLTLTAFVLLNRVSVASISDSLNTTMSACSLNLIINCTKVSTTYFV